MTAPAAEFGPILKGIRETRKVSQSRLAARAAFDHSYVSRLESGARVPTRDAVERLATALGAFPGDRESLLGAAGFLSEGVAALGAVRHLLREYLRIAGEQQVRAVAIERLLDGGG